MKIRLSRLSIVALGLALTVGAARAEAQQSREEELALAQAEKAKALRPYEPNAAERAIAKAGRALMGPPTGTYLFPLVQRRTDSGLVYIYTQTRVEPIPFAPKIRQYRKVLVVSLGDDGIVSNVEFNASGEK